MMFRSPAATEHKVAQGDQQRGKAHVPHGHLEEIIDDVHAHDGEPAPFREPTLGNVRRFIIEPDNHDRVRESWRNRLQQGVRFGDGKHPISGERHILAVGDGRSDAVCLEIRPSGGDHYVKLLHMTPRITQPNRGAACRGRLWSRWPIADRTGGIDQFPPLDGPVLDPRIEVCAIGGHGI